MMWGRLLDCRCGHQRQLHADTKVGPCLRCPCAEFVRPHPQPPVNLIRGQGRRRRANMRGLDVSADRVNATATRKYACARCGKEAPAEQLLFSTHTRNRYCTDINACARRAKRNHERTT